MLEGVFRQGLSNLNDHAIERANLRYRRARDRQTWKESCEDARHEAQWYENKVSELKESLATRQLAHEKVLKNGVAEHSKLKAEISRLTELNRVTAISAKHYTAEAYRLSEVATQNSKTANAQAVEIASLKATAAATEAQLAAAKAAVDPVRLLLSPSQAIGWDGEPMSNLALIYDFGLREAETYADATGWNEADDEAAAAYAISEASRAYNQALQQALHG